jgi:hypothetical protein
VQPAGIEPTAARLNGARSHLASYGYQNWEVVGLASYPGTPCGVWRFARRSAPYGIPCTGIFAATSIAGSGFEPLASWVMSPVFYQTELPRNIARLARRLSLRRRLGLALGIDTELVRGNTVIAILKRSGHIWALVWVGVRLALASCLNASLSSLDNAGSLVGLGLLFVFGHGR